MQIYVGNLACDVTADDLRRAFAPLGAVTHASIVTDDVSGNSKGFGFVFMPNRQHGQLAIDTLITSMLRGFELYVNEMLPLIPHASHRLPS